MVIIKFTHSIIANEELKNLDLVISQLETRVAQMRASLQEEAAILQTTSVNQHSIHILRAKLCVGCCFSDIGKSEGQASPFSSQGSP